MRARVQSIQRQISENAKVAGRSPESIRLLAVSKTHNASKIREAYGLGLRDFG